MVTGETKIRGSKRSFWIELPILVVVAVVAAIIVRTFLVQTFFIPSESMERTLLKDDKVLVNKMVYQFRDPQRGEVIVFKAPAEWAAPPGKEDLIKRVVAVGGDHVVCCDAQRRITVNGAALDEDYLFPGDAPSSQPFDVVVPQGRVFVLGDHRTRSADSRAHIAFERGTVPLDRVVGRAFVLFWPLDRARSLSPPDAFARVPDPR